MRPCHALALVLLVALLVAAPARFADDARAEGSEGTLRGVVTVVGQKNLRDGEVWIYTPDNDADQWTAGFDSSDPTYTIDLPPGEYSAHAVAPVFHPSNVETFTIAANQTTWVDFTVVRLEEVMGNATTPQGDPVVELPLQFYQGDSINFTTWTDTRGFYRLSILPETYTLKAHKRGYEPLEREVTIAPGQVLTLDLEMTPIPVEEEDAEFPWLPLMVGVFIFASLGLSFGYVARQARRMRTAAAEAEAKRTVDMECPECGARLPQGTSQCPECQYHFQVRCDECGRSMDAGTAECPECGVPMG